MKLRSFALVATLLAAGSCTHQKKADNGLPETAQLEDYKLGSIKKLTTFGGLYFAGQPSPDDLALAREQGFKTVINFRHAKEVPWDEQRVVEQLGMNYVHLPFSGADELTDEVLRSGRALLRDVERPAMVHCGSSNRVGAIWYAARVLDHGATEDDALEEAKKAGLRSKGYIDRARAYVEQERRFRGF